MNTDLEQYFLQLTHERNEQIEANKLSNRQIKWLKFKDWIFNTRVKIIRR